jgi:hypothetical protein
VLSHCLFVFSRYMQRWRFCCCYISLSVAVAVARVLLYASLYVLLRQTGHETTADSSDAQLWGRKVSPLRTAAKLGREVRGVCHAILSARNPATLNAEKRRLLEMAGSVERLYDIIRYYKVTALL